jgi:hypothetical protein
MSSFEEVFVWENILSDKAVGNSGRHDKQEDEVRRYLFV